MNKLYNKSGFTLVEIVIVIIILGIIAAVASKQMGSTIEDAKYEQTKKELDNLAHAIAGNPDIYSEGIRTDYGYVGDIGSLPPDLDALISNPGGYSTWNGPYIVGGDGNDFKQDAWDVNYTYTGTTIRSTGSGSNIDKQIAVNSNALLNNTVKGFIIDANSNVPGMIYTDSLQIRFSYPNGSGGTAITALNPSPDGSFSYSNIPIGNHILEVIFLPASDTMNYTVSVNPLSTTKIEVIFPADLF